MSQELKVYKILGIEFDSQFYHKPEVDTVLAEKDAEIARLTAALNTSIVDKLTNNKTAEEAKEQQNG